MKNCSDEVESLSTKVKRLCFDPAGCGAVFIDGQAESLRAGFATDDGPRIVFPSIVGYPSAVERLLHWPNLKSFYCGNEAQARRNILTISSPLSNGIVNNWDDMETLWRHTFLDALHVSPEEHPVLLTSSPMAQRKQKERTAEIMFETFKTPAVCLVTTAALAVFASGRTTGLVVDTGEDVSKLVPIVDGSVLRPAVQHLSFTDSDLTAHLKQLLVLRSRLHATIRNETVRDIKEKLCYLSMNFYHEMTDVQTKEKPFQLLDGSLVKLSYERFSCPEAMFDPPSMGIAGSGLHVTIVNSILRSDLVSRRDLLANIVLIGGISKFPNISKRLHEEVARLLPPVKISVTVPSAESDIIWAGASIASSLPSLKTTWINRAEYEDAGPSIVHRKFF